MNPTNVAPRSIALQYAGPRSIAQATNRLLCPTTHRKGPIDQDGVVQRFDRFSRAHFQTRRGHHRLSVAQRGPRRVHWIDHAPDGRGHGVDSGNFSSRPDPREPVERALDNHPAPAHPNGADHGRAGNDIRRNRTGEAAGRDGASDLPPCHRTPQDHSAGHGSPDGHASHDGGSTDHHSTDLCPPVQRHRPRRVQRHRRQSE